MEKIYILCPRFRTGGPESAHRLCEYLNDIGQNAFMYYPPDPSNQSPHQSLYPEFNNIRVATHIEDNEKNLLILPEIADIADIRRVVKRIHIALWWLSYTNASIFGVLWNNLKEGNVIHLFQSYFAYAMVSPFLPPSTPWFFITDHIHEDFLSLPQPDSQTPREKQVAYNGSKDKLTPMICHHLNIPSVNIQGLSREEVIKTLQGCTAYVDMGFHPGKDKLPRESALCGCVVITNKSGSAEYMEDVFIQEKVRFEKDLMELLPAVMEDPNRFYQNQKPYRNQLLEEKELCKENIKAFVENINLLLSQPSSPSPSPV